MTNIGLNIGEERVGERKRGDRYMEKIRIEGEIVREREMANIN